ncbi:MAG: type II toxin-antitoxin system RelE/ParE family toxin [Actinomycetota bacterium]|nr:type II toxin-antitoxin system RelE/ParE family toxin [Actinomycetota bacterium]
MDLEFVERWLYDLYQNSYEQVIAALEWLIDRRPQLGRPLVDTVKASRHKNMKELRPSSRGRSELRILFSFDLERNAVLLVAGDKSKSCKKWYQVKIPVADKRFDDHIRKQKGGS